MLIAFDTETYLMRDGLRVPPMVCLSYATPDGSSDLLGKEDATTWFREHIKNTSIHWGGVNISYDMCVMVENDPSVLPHVFKAYDDGRVHDAAIREALLRNAQGTYGGSAFIGLGELAKQYLGRDRSATKKGPDVWRTRYAELDGVPVKMWPEAAVTYALDDAVDSLRVLLAQSSEQIYVEASGRTVALLDDDGMVVNEQEQTRAAFALQLMSAHGLRVDQTAARDLQDGYRAEHAALELQLKRDGIIRPDKGTTDTAVLKQIIVDHITADATDAQRTAFAKRYAELEQQFYIDDEAKIARGEKKSKGKFSATQQSIAAATAWKELGFKIPTSDKTGDVQKGEEVLEVVPDERLRRYVAYKSLEKTLQTYLEPMVNAGENALCPGYDPLKTSGRTSSSGPNIQNFKRSGGERECFVPRDGFLYVAADYSTVELRAWAQVCEDLGIVSEMAVALRQGRDLHSDFGARLRRVSYEQQLLDEKSDDYAVREEASLFRGAAKPGNFGLPVMMGAAKLEESARKSYGVDFREIGLDSEEVRDAWFDRWKEAHAYKHHITSLLRVVGYTTEYDEELGIEVEKAVQKAAIQHPRSGRVRGGCYFCDAANSYFQGMAADGAKLALWLVARECYATPSSPLFGSRPVAFIHDEIIIESPVAKVQAAAQRLRTVMIYAMEQFIPSIPIVCEADIMDRWSKKAKSETKPDGTLEVFFFDVYKKRKAASSLMKNDPEAAAVLQREADLLQRQKEKDYGIAS